MDRELSEREQEIMNLISTGMDRYAIGERLDISKRTIDGYVYKIFKKTGAKNIIEAINIVTKG